MYRPAHFQETRAEVLHALMRTHPLATLVWQGAGQLHADLLPLHFRATAQGAGVLRGHVARANPLWREIDPGSEVLAVFQGPQAYVSPSWYPGKQVHGKVVPTWNYAVVQARGVLEVHPEPDWLHALVSELTDVHESRFARPWAVSDAPEDYVAGMLRAIVGIEIPLRQLDGKWKVSQNRAAEDRQGVIQALQSSASAAEQAMAELVRAHAPDPQA